MSTKPQSTEANAPTQPKLRYTPRPKGSWRRAVGMLKDSAESREAFRLGAEWRAKMNRKGH